MFPAIEVLLFGAVGVATTVIDFAVFNLLTRAAVGWPRIPANVVSVSIAMAWSFLAYWHIVFHPSSQDVSGMLGRFLVTTAFSAFVLQNIILHLTTNVWKGPVHAGLYVARAFRPKRPVNDELISRNICKACAVSAGLVWNFCWYKFFVYPV